MTADTHTTTKNQIEAGYETSKFALGLGITMAAFAGIWGTVCLISAMISMGPLNVVRDYFSALIG